MAVEPELLCLDEPFSALDVLSAESLRGDLLELWLSGKIPTKAILLVTHNIEEAVQLADRIVVMDTRPGRIISDLRVRLPHPRSRKDMTFLEFVDRIYGLLAGQTQPEAVELGTAPGEPGPTRPLPHVNIESLAELLEYLENKPAKQTDIFALAQELQLSSDELLTLIEAAELFRLCHGRPRGCHLDAAGGKPLLWPPLWAARRFSPPGSAACLSSGGCGPCCRRLKGCN